MFQITKNTKRKVATKSSIADRPNGFLAGFRVAACVFREVALGFLEPICGGGPGVVSGSRVMWTSRVSVILNGSRSTTRSMGGYSYHRDLMNSMW